jgi:3-hydroxyisobutyrate dehydrogenase
MAERKTLGYIGLGLMGTAMCERLLEKGWHVTVWNLEKERVAPIIALGAAAAASPAEVAVKSDITLMCVLHTEAVRTCVFGPDGIASAGRLDGKVLVDHSTIDPAASRAMAEELRGATGMAWVDAPISGGPPAARSGTMAVMAGGAAADIEAVRSVMQDLAANFTHMGPAGAGQTTKVINQAIVGAGFVVMAEALALAERAGIDAARLPECLAGGFADSSLLRRIYPQMQERRFEPPLSYARQLLKDMKFVKEFAHAHGLDLPVVETAAAQYAAYVGAGNEMVDSASIVRLYEKK